MEIRLTGGAAHGQSVTLDRSDSGGVVTIALQKWGEKTVVVASPFTEAAGGKRPRPGVEVVLLAYSPEGRYIGPYTTQRHSALEVHA